VTRFYSERLETHDRKSFTSGNDRIDSYFGSIVSQDIKRNYATCYVLVEREGLKIAGFYTLSATNIPLTDIPQELSKKLPRYPVVPAVLIGWLGRDLAFRGQGIGPMLLQDAIIRVSKSNIGAFAICADAIDEAAAAFYREHLFTPFASRANSLFLPMKTALLNL
jgi:ribosomal protein S18 acetylase RimI-like enzyme